MINVIKKENSYIIDIEGLSKIGSNFIINDVEFSLPGLKKGATCVVDSIPVIVQVVKNSSTKYIDNDGNAMSAIMYDRMVSEHEQEISLYQSRGDIEKQNEQIALLEKFKSQFYLVTDNSLNVIPVQISIRDYIEDTSFVIMDRDFSGNFFSTLGVYNEAQHCIDFFSKLFEGDSFVMNKNAVNGYHYYDLSKESYDSYVSFTFPGNYHIRLDVFKHRKNSVSDLIHHKHNNEEKWKKIYEDWKRNYGITLTGIQVNEVLNELENLKTNLRRITTRNNTDRKFMDSSLNIIRNLTSKLDSFKEE